VVFDLERRGKSGIACRGTYCPSASPHILGETGRQWIYLQVTSVYNWWTLYTNGIPPIKHLSGRAKPFPASTRLRGNQFHVIMLLHHWWHTSIERPQALSNSVVGPRSVIPYKNRMLVLSYTREYDMECGTLSAIQYSLQVYSAKGLRRGFAIPSGMCRIRLGEKWQVGVCRWMIGILTMDLSLTS
jgi:hypothetical protein